ncbi:MAG TPA: Nramp family divalent metal transporter [Gemmatimonadaceae bacterium]|nr:Nramp family divalent metal transporter [Gemmatimonadaceae bacterium]
MKKILQISLGIVTSVGGFLEIGSVMTAAQAGAAFGYQLLWAILLGTLCLIFLVEMSGRLAAVSKHTIVEAMRERFGFPFFFIVLIGMVLVAFMVLVAELGGIGLSLQILTGIGFPWWAAPVSLLVWLLMWKGTFGLIENGASLLGLVTICFIVAAIKLRPDWSSAASGLVPTMPHMDKAHYGFIAVSILGASISPYLMYFYSSGAIEDKWDESYIPINRLIAGLGMTFGGVLSMAVLVTAALALRPRGIQVDAFDQAALLTTTALPKWGFYLFAMSMLFACFGAALEISLAIAYFFAQGFGWNWSEDLEPSKDARFSLVYTIIILLAAIPLVAGIDPVKVTMVSMALTAATLPLAIVPFLFLMNDPIYMGKHRNGWLSNSVVAIVILISFVLAVISIPLQIIGG